MNISRMTLGAGALLLLLATGLATWASFRPSPSPRADGRSSLTDSPRTTEARPVRPAAPADLPAPQLSPFAGTSTEHREWLHERREALMDLSWMDDKASLDAILTELWNPDAEIREAALKATMNFSSRDAIPRLQAAALRADDPAERKQLEEAAEFLKLPTLTEHLAKQRNKTKRAE
ncbi:HEAT repeat domain-containing protein [Luteolibacter arcticus]|uniref:HEAT repeat domain-containing protein n=1 Tax=Luteolibacter arcticus TaxID=1581411 RepID=A0ABT3GG34_9BACT|nr:HEAT repeat domain-containing protein [Luteolibacter arcticus]MCW1922218.1 HEAT repeat domain-containing protein [Luteolibacter arcticus]